MTIRIKTLIIIGTILLGLIAILYLNSRVILLRSFVALEEQFTRREVMRIRDTLDQRLAAMDALTASWAAWNGEAPGTANREMHFLAWCHAMPLVENNIDLALLTDANGNIRQAAGIDARTRTLTPLARPLYNQLTSIDLPAIIKHRHGAVTGIAPLASRPLLLAIQPFADGTRLVLGRYLDQDDELKSLAMATHLRLELGFPFNGKWPDAAYQQALEEMQGEATVTIHPLDGHTMAGYLLLNDILGRPTAIIRAVTARSIYRQGQTGTQYFLVALIVIGLVFSLAVMLLLVNIVLSPLASLSRSVTRVGDSGDPSARVPAAGTDELAQLGHAVNGMLSALQHSQEALRLQESQRVSEQHYRTLVELSPDAVFIINADHVIFANAAGLTLLGTDNADNLVNRPVQELFPPDRREQLIRRLRQVATDQDFPLCEEQLLRLDGTPVEVEMEAVPFTYQEMASVQVVARDITERKRFSERLNYLAYYDALTGFPNRTLFNDRLNQALALAQRRSEPLIVMVLDLDRFKETNDTLGHHIGDRLLQEVATRLRGCLRESDTIARIGGDEFFFILPNTDGTLYGDLVAQKVLDAFATPFLIDTHELYVTASLGISQFPVDGVSVEGLVKNAETAMYRAKSGGRNGYKSYTSEMSTQVSERRTLENNLRKAIEREELEVYYQPQIDIATGAVVGSEALLRWPHPELGMIAPMLFIPLAEETGLIAPLGEWVLRQACLQNQRWRQEGHGDLRVAVNLSALQFQDQHLVVTIVRMLRETGLPPHLLEMEITESTAMQNIEHTLSVLRELDAQGVRIAIDDFGTGYSSFSYLTKFPIHTLKIDRTFIKDIMTDPDDAAIVAAIIAMTHSLRRRVIAEAVETVEQLEFLRAHECDEVQGYLLGRPVPANEFPRFLTAPNVLMAGASSDITRE